MSLSEGTNLNDDIMSSLAGIRRNLAFTPEHTIHIVGGSDVPAEWDLESIDWDELKNGEWTVEPSGSGVSDWGSVEMADEQDYDNHFPHSFRRRF
jgi:hypothetical protein